MEALLILSLQALLRTALNPAFWLMTGLVYLRYRQETGREDARLLTLRSAGEGMSVGGIIMLMTAGFGFFAEQDPALLLIGPAAWLLSLADRRFFCFSYGAALVISLCRLLGRPIDGAGIAVLAGLLHFGEGALVWGSGKRGGSLRIVPGGGRLISQRALFRLWPVPLGLLIAAGEGGTAEMTMPAWWPLLGGGREIYGLLPLAATLGYEAVILRAGEERRQTRRDGARILLYGAALMAAGCLCARWSWGETPVLLWMLLGHEGLFRLAERVREEPDRAAESP